MNADALICSPPRSGGRLLRFLLAHYLAARHELEIDVTPQTAFSVVPDHHDEPTRGYPALRVPSSHRILLAAVCHHPYSRELHHGYPVAFLARNPYDVLVSSYYHLAQEKGQYAGTMRDLIRQPVLGLPSWIRYMNGWAPKLMGHRDALLLSYRELDLEPGRALARLLEFLGEEPIPELVQAAAERGSELRRARVIRTGQEGNFWDHLQPDEIFDVQDVLDRGLSEFAAFLLDSMGVELDPFPRDMT